MPRLPTPCRRLVRARREATGSGPQPQSHLDDRAAGFDYAGDGSGPIRPASSTSGSNNETINWTNNTGCDVTGVMEIEHWLSDQNADCNDYDVIVTGEGPGTCGGPGTVYCTPGNANSTGVPGSIAAAGSAVAAANDLTLTASDLPANQLGYFIGGTGNTAFTPPGAAGPFCLGGAPLSRFLTGPTTTSAGGTLTHQVRLNSVPNFGAIMTGDTFNFQVWHQDGGGSNFTDAISVTFQ